MMRFASKIMKRYPVKLPLIRAELRFQEKTYMKLQFPHPFYIKVSCIKVGRSSVNPHTNVIKKQQRLIRITEDYTHSVFPASSRFLFSAK